MATSVRARHARRETFRAIGKAAVAVSIILIGVVGVQMVQRNGADGDMYFGGISCTEVRKQAADYMVARLPSEVSKRIETHLAECPNCQKFLREMQQRPMGDAGDDDAPRLVSFDSEHRQHSVQAEALRIDRRMAWSPVR